MPGLGVAPASAGELSPGAGPSGPGSSRPAPAGARRPWPGGCQSWPGARRPWPKAHPCRLGARPAGFGRGPAAGRGPCGTCHRPVLPGRRPPLPGTERYSCCAPISPGRACCGCCSMRTPSWPVLPRPGWRRCVPSSQACGHSSRAQRCRRPVSGPPAIPDAALAGIRHTMNRMMAPYLGRRGKQRYCDQSRGAAEQADVTPCRVSRREVPVPVPASHGCDRFRARGGAVGAQRPRVRLVCGSFVPEHGADDRPVLGGQCGADHGRRGTLP